MGEITYLSLFILALLIIPTLISNHLLGIKSNKRIIISVIRMTIQLSIVGLYLGYIFEWNNPFLNIGYMVLMMMIATITIASSAELKLKRMFVPLLFSMIIPNILIVLFVNSVVISLDNVLEARYIITISGMLLGNVLNGDIVGLITYYRGIKDNRERVNYDLALGATRFQATKVYFKEAIQASIKPTVASMATIGLISLPGMVTGQILGGSIPMEAIMYQIMIMIAIYVTRYTNIFFAIQLSQKTMFNKRDQLIN